MKQLHRHSECTYSISVHTDTPEVPPSFTVSSWVRDIHEKSGNIFGMSIDVAVVGTAQLEYWHKHKICSEIFKTVYSMGIMSKHD